MSPSSACLFKRSARPPDFPQSVNDVDQEILSTSQQSPNDEVQDPPSSPVLDLNNVSLLDSVTVSLTNNQRNPPAQKSPQTSDKVLKSLSHAPSDSEPNSLNCSKVYPESLVNCCLTKLALMAKLNCNLEVSFHQCQETDINYYYPPNSPTMSQKLDIPQTPDRVTKKSNYYTRNNKAISKSCSPKDNTAWTTTWKNKNSNKNF
ncbi:unnamed protein product [Parnassius apollo]|uniref:(apollo) hypothetical protein n=1 Tax=Parnassius apollo TaxID=110799 RepID=A0A8S3WPQ4_PARAO|nr:unnamed protein product [Parnassius apollo]